MRFSTERAMWTEPLQQQGQATVEAAFLLPVLFVVVALLVQPAIVLYDRCVMEAAAAETCRLASTYTSHKKAVEAFAQRRLAAVPQLDVFHSGGCPWQVDIEGGECATEAKVTITGHLKMLPLVGVSASTLTHAAGDGCAVLSVTITSSQHPSWIENVDGSPAEWIGAWK